MAIEYRKLCEKDLDIFIEMRINQLREEGAKEDIDLKPALRDYYIRHMKDGTFVSWIAVDDEKIIGMQKLQEVLVKRLSENTVSDYLQTTNMDFLDMFLTAKHLEGCSDKTIRYYRCNIEKMLDTINIPVIKITAEMLRKYLVEYQTINNCGKVTIDNIRRSLSTFFSWLEEEDYIIKSPMKRIHKVKTAVIVKDTIPDEKIEILRDNCNNLRDRAMIDFLLSTGIRVGELVRLNIDDIDFSERECVVYGKGDKERKAYFDAKTKIHLLNYIESRTDNNIAYLCR